MGEFETSGHGESRARTVHRVEPTYGACSQKHSINPDFCHASSRTQPTQTYVARHQKNPGRGQKRRRTNLLKPPPSSTRDKKQPSNPVGQRAHVGLYDAFVVDNFVQFILRATLYGTVGHIAHNVMRVLHGDRRLRIAAFHHVHHGFQIDFLGRPEGQRDAAHLATRFTCPRPIGVVFGTGRHKCFYPVSVIHLVGKLTQKVSPKGGSHSPSVQV